MDVIERLRQEERAALLHLRRVGDGSPPAEQRYASAVMARISAEVVMRQWANGRLRRFRWQPWRKAEREEARAVLMELCA